MDLSAPISYNGLTLSPPPPVAGSSLRSGVEFTSIDVSSVGIDGYLDGRAAQDGVDASDVFQRARTIEIGGAVYGSSSGDLWDRMQGVLDAFNPVLAESAAIYGGVTSTSTTWTYLYPNARYGFLPLTFRQPTIDTASWSAGYIPARYYARPAAPPRFRITRQATNNGGRGFSVPFTVTLVARDPLKYAQDVLWSNIISSGSSGSYAYTNRGTYPTWPTYFISIAGSTSSTLTIDQDGESVVLDVSGLATNFYLLDYANRRFIKDDGDGTYTDYTSRISNVSNFTKVSAAGGTVVATTSGTVNIVRIYYREAWP